MTLLDAPKFDPTREKRKALIIRSSVAGVFVLFVAWWLVAGRPVDWPWNWDRYLFGRTAANRFMTDIVEPRFTKAYGDWFHDKNWQQHPQKYATYPLNRFRAIGGRRVRTTNTARFAASRLRLIGHYGNGVLVAILINGRKSNALNLAYNPKTGQLSFAPPGVSLYLGP